MRSILTVAAASTIALATSNFAIAQDSNAAFVTKCSPGQWALTFDDGPSEFTQELLQTLSTAKVPATFYVLGVQLESPALAKFTKAAFDAGHLIASHTYNHLDLNTLTADQIKEQMTRSEALIQSTTGRRPNYMRPPFGNCGPVCAGVMKELGYVVTTWDVDSNDWRVKDTPEESKAFDAFTTALATANPASSGHMSLQHDTIPFSVKMVPKIISAIKAKGFTFVTADKCAGGKVPAYRDGPAPTPGTLADPASNSTSNPTSNPTNNTANNTANSSTKNPTGNPTSTVNTASSQAKENDGSVITGGVLVFALAAATATFLV